MSILLIPNEVLLLIIDYLPSSSISHLCQANRTLYSFLTPFLYRTALGSDHGSLVLHSTARKNQPAALLSLISHGAAAYPTPSGHSLLHTAAMSGHIKILEVVLARDTDMNFDINIDHPVPKTGDTALHLAIKGGHGDAVEYLIDQGADVRCVDSRGNTPLHWAIEFGDVRTLDHLLYIAPFELLFLENSSYQSPLSVAATLGKVDAVRKLLLHGADIDQQNRYGYTALHRAGREGHADVAEVLIQYGADLFLKDEIGQDALSFAVVGGHVVVAEMLRKAMSVQRARRGFVVTEEE